MKRLSHISMLLLAGVLLASCGKAAKEPTKETEEKKVTESSIAETETAAETEERIDPELPEMNLGGYNFRVYTRGTESVHWKSKDIYAESSNGEPINDAVFSRNTKLGEKYNFTVTEIPAKDRLKIGSDTAKTIQAGNDEYDMIAGGLTTDYTALTSKKCLWDLNLIPYMDLSKPWYDQKFNSQISIGGKLYAAAGDMIIMDNEATLGILFNKRLASELDIENLYKTVENGKWTIDLLRSYAKDGSADLDGDGVHGDNDRWGIIGEPFNTFAYIMAMGEHIVKKNADDLPELVIQNDRFYSAFEKAYSVNGDFDFCMYSDNLKGYTDVWSECIDKAFSEGRVLFNCAGLVRVTVFRGMDIDFGILPLPKYDESQDTYYSPVSIDCTNSIMIPITVPDTEKTGFIIEAMSAESLYTLTPAYYDVALKGKGARDAESYGMLDLIFSNRVVDLGYMFDWGGMFTEVRNLTSNTSPDIASTVEKKMSAAQKAMEKTIKNFAEDD